MMPTRQNLGDKASMAVQAWLGKRITAMPKLGQLAAINIWPYLTGIASHKF
jgi:hypothetical protein